MRVIGSVDITHLYVVLSFVFLKTKIPLNPLSPDMICFINVAEEQSGGERMGIVTNTGPSSIWTEPLWRTKEVADNV